MRLARLGLAALLLAAPDGLSAQDQPDPYIGIPAPLDATAKQAVAGINHFTLDLFKRLKPGENLFVSPASVSTAIALAYRGARGVTADEIRRTLYYSAPPEAYLSAQAPLLRAMTFAGVGRQLSTSNGLWIQDGLPLNPGYLADVTANAGAGLQRVDYRIDHERARLTINKWVSDKTNNRINDLLAPDVVTSNTRAILVNTIYWKGNWTTQFEAASTRVEPFHSLKGGTIPTPLMHLEASFRVAERGGVKAIEMPYGQGEVSMVALMPDKPGGLVKFEAGLTDATLTKWLADLDAATPRRTILTLPKMHLEWGGDLVPTLQGMGIKTAFDERADFTGTATVPTDQVLAIGAIIHQAWLDVDEHGSEAAAATAVVEFVVTGARKRAPEPPPFVFRADRPFVFLLRDRRTRAILFIGRYVTPMSKT